MHGIDQTGQGDDSPVTSYDIDGTSIGLGNRAATDDAGSETMDGDPADPGPADDGTFTIGAVVRHTHERRNAEHRTRLERFSHLEPWKKWFTFRWALIFLLIGLAFLTVASLAMYHDAREAESYQWSADNPHTQQKVADAAALGDEYGATHVLTGTYIESLNQVDIKDSTYDVTMLLWFRWDGDPDLNMTDNFNIYRGTIVSKDLLTEETVGDTHYQLMRVDVTINTRYDSKRFPLDSQQLDIYVESEYKADRVILEPDLDQSSANTALYVSGYSVDEIGWGQSAHEYVSTQSDPTVDEHPITSEFVTTLDISRSGFGLYFKCFLAMYGTSLWVLIMLFICGRHRVDPLGMIPGALFGTVSNIMVGAALLPDALDMGLLEYVNIWGILTIIAAALAIIQINNIRAEHGRGDEAFAEFYGEVMSIVIISVVIIGNVALPAIAYLL